MNVEEQIKTQKKIPLESRTIIHLLLISNKISETTSGALKPFDVSPEQFNVLRILKGQGGRPANLCTLNERMITKMSNTSRLVDKLLAKGFVSRHVCKVNRRKIEILITPEGEKALEVMNKAMQASEQELLAHFTERELRDLNRLLDHF